MKEIKYTILYPGIMSMRTFVIPYDFGSGMQSGSGSGSAKAKSSGSDQIRIYNTTLCLSTTEVSFWIRLNRSRCGPLSPVFIYVSVFIFRWRSVWLSRINQSRRSIIAVTPATCDLLRKGDLCFGRILFLRIKNENPIATNWPSMTNLLWLPCIF